MVLTSTDFIFPDQVNFYKGKVRDVYNIAGKYLLMIATDRISAFDIILPAGIPYKGQILNQIASRFLDLTKDIVPNWKLDTPDPCVTAGLICNPFKVEMVVRGYLCGHAWRLYKSGKREICGVKLPDGMVENEKFDNPIITPTTKASEGHDEDISRDKILSKGIVGEDDYKLLESYSLQLFERGTQLAREKGLILVDTKYEFGKNNGTIMLIDEIHTPDSSRYFYLDEYKERLQKQLPQKQLSKEFVREWLLENGFSGKQDDQMPQITDEFANSVSQRYIELYEKLTGHTFSQEPVNDLRERVYKNSIHFISKQSMV